MIEAAIPDQIHSHTVPVNDSYMHYLECGTGEPILFLHGNPTSSYLWRNVMPHLESKGRCVAVDYIGMGRSGKPAIGYRLVDHIAYVEAFLDALGIQTCTLVAHDWGVVIGLHLCQRYPERFRGIAFMEGHIRPVTRWDDFDADSATMFKQLRAEQSGRKMVLEENFFIETILPAGTKRMLTPDEMEWYRAPFEAPKDRVPMLRWVKEIPIENQPADVHAIVAANQAFLATSDLPKLLLHAEPGAVIGAAEVRWCVETCRNLSAVNVGDGIHFLPEDHPDTIGDATAAWISTRS